MSDVQQTIQSQINEHPIVLYMKGTPQAPQCGFSARVVQLLQTCGTDDYFSVNVLADENIRDGIKQFSNWPTVPQLYINQEFVGGCDIVTDLFRQGELQKLVAATQG